MAAGFAVESRVKRSGERSYGIDEGPGSEDGELQAGEHHFGRWADEIQGRDLWDISGEGVINNAENSILGECWCH